VRPDPTNEREREDLERRVEALAGEIAELINSSKGAAERSDLRDLALSIVREEVQIGEGTPIGREAPGGAPKSFNTAAMGIPVFLTGAVLVPLFPPMGLLLLATALGLILWGVAASLVSGLARHLRIRRR
jgi:hypothetical protein